MSISQIRAELRSFTVRICPKNSVAQILLSKRDCSPSVSARFYHAPIQDNTPGNETAGADSGEVSAPEATSGGVKAQISPEIATRLINSSNRPDHSTRAITRKAPSRMRGPRRANTGTSKTQLREKAKPRINSGEVRQRKTSRD